LRTDKKSSPNGEGLISNPQNADIHTNLGRFKSANQQSCEKR